MTRFNTYRKCKKDGRVVLRALFLLFILTFLTNSTLPVFDFTLDGEFTEQCERGEQENDKEENKKESKVDDFVHGWSGGSTLSHSKSLLVTDTKQYLRYRYADILTPPPERI